MTVEAFGHFRTTPHIGCLLIAKAYGASEEVREEESSDRKIGLSRLADVWEGKNMKTRECIKVQAQVQDFSCILVCVYRYCVLFECKSIQLYAFSSSYLG